MLVKASGLRELLFICMFALSVHCKPTRSPFPSTEKTSVTTHSEMLVPTTTPVSALTTQAMDESEAIDYLKRVGYMDEGTHVGDGPATMQDLSEALKRLQRFTGLEETGVLDEATIKVMKSPRCGLKDTVDSASMLTKRFSAAGKWSERDLTYVIENYPTNSYNLNSRDLVDSEIKRAFKDWSDVANLKFTRKTDSPSDIEVGFYSGDHNDANSFDGPGVVLAHAFYPQDGRLHGDNDEQWSYNHLGGPNLRQVMTHEVGHIIGLGHSDEMEAVMYPYYSYRPNFELATDDINGARHLYGPSKTTSIPQTTPTPQTTPISHTIPISETPNAVPQTAYAVPLTAYAVPVIPTDPPSETTGFSWRDWFYSRFGV